MMKQGPNLHSRNTRPHAGRPDALDAVSSTAEKPPGNELAGESRRMGARGAFILAASVVILLGLSLWVYSSISVPNPDSNPPSTTSSPQQERATQPSPP